MLIHLDIWQRVVESGPMVDLLLAFSFTIYTRVRKQPICLPGDEEMVRIWYIYIVGFYSAVKKKQNKEICREMDGNRTYYIELSGLDLVRHISHVLTYV